MFITTHQKILITSENSKAFPYELVVYILQVQTNSLVYNASSVLSAGIEITDKLATSNKTKTKIVHCRNI
jgi:hypothetical protein